MKFESVEQFIKNHIRFQQHWNKKVIGLNDALWQELKENTWLDGCSYAKGSLFKVFETRNFGWVVFKSGTLTPEGYAPGKRFIKY